LCNNHKKAEEIPCETEVFYMSFKKADCYNLVVTKKVLINSGRFQNMRKKALSVLMAAAMIASVTSGCGSAAATTASSAASSAAPAAASSVAAPAATSAAATSAATSTAAASTTAASIAESAATSAAAKNVDLSKAKVGVCIYQFSDNFMTLFRGELEKYLESKGFSKGNIEIVDGANDQATQTNQIQNFITEGVNVLVINPVNSSSAETITDMVVKAKIPLVYINREPDATEEARWKTNNWNVTYVGCDAKQSGTLQGQIIAGLGMDKLDMNKNGTVDYIMIQGDPENVDAKYRTQYSVKALTDAGLKVKCLDSEVGNWDQATAQQLVANALSQYGKNVEVVFCNNDAMALGALQSIQAANRTVGKDIYLVGVDALSEALEDIQKGTMTGTVFNDHISQSHSAADAAINFITGKTNKQYIGCDYIKVTKDNVAEIQAKVKG